MVGVTPGQDPSAKSAERRDMDADWTKIADVLAGLPAVRAKSTVYLPKYQGESATDYKFRLDSTSWRPEFEDALRSLASKPFDRDVAIETKSQEVKDLAEDVDGKGNSLTVFAAEAFKRAIAKGLHVVLIDYPPAPVDAEGRPVPARTKREEIDAKVRPYWVHIDANDIIALYREWRGGVSYVTHFRYRETKVERDGFNEKRTERVRVYEPGKCEVWVKNDKGEWSIDPAASTTTVRGGLPADQQTIPIVLFYTGDQEGELKVKPPLSNLAEMQLEIYRSMSRKDEILTYAGSPMLTGNGMARPGKGQAAVAVGPKRVLYAPPGKDGSSASWAFIQPDAANITEIRNDLQDLLTDFRRLAMQPATRDSGAPSATGESIEAAKAHSAVERWAQGLKDALEQAWTITCQWINVEPDVECDVHTDFDVLPFAQAPLTALASARGSGDISRETYWKGLRRFDVLEPDFDPEEEEERLADEAANDSLQGEADIDPATGEPVDPEPDDGGDPIDPADVSKMTPAQMRALLGNDVADAAGIA